MKLKQIVLILAIVLSTPVVLYGAIYAYLYDQVTSELAGLKRELEPVAYLGYAEVRVGALGGVEVDDFELVMLDSGRAIEIDRIAMRASDPLWLPVISGLRRIALPDLPQELSVELIGLRLQRDDVAAVIEYLSGVRADSSGVGRRVLAGICGLPPGEEMRRWLDRSLPEEPVYDLRIRIQDGPRGGADVLSLTLNLHQVGELRLDLFARLNRYGAAAGLLDAASIRKLDLDSRLDAEWLSGAKQTCASMGGASAASIDRRLIDDADSIFGDIFGLVPDDALLDALRDYLAGKALNVVLDPTALDLVGSYPPESVAELIDLQVSVEGEQLTRPGFRAPRAPVVSVEAAAADAPARPGDLIDFDVLARCLGCVVTVRLKDGRERQGVADDLDATTLSLMSFVRAYSNSARQTTARKGTMTVYLRRTDIEWVRFEAPPR